jgi:hypothetical protein
MSSHKNSLSAQRGRSPRPLACLSRRPLLALAALSLLGVTPGCGTSSDAATDAGGSADLGLCASLEVCNGRDDDCDGDIDEGFGVGDSCAGVGVCAAGLVECSGTGGTVCSTHPGGSVDQSGMELCNGLDDDCDGGDDEDFSLGTPCDGEGACGAGTRQCDPRDTAQLTAICSTEPGGSQNQALPSDALCNGVDDDCDGAVDEDRGIGLACEGTGECGAGVTECATLNTTRCSSNPGGSAQMGSFEVCDDLDNNCNGATDEGFGTGAACVGACGAGVVECATAATTRCTTDICP